MLDTEDHVSLGLLGEMVDLLRDIAKMLDRQASRDGITFKFAGSTQEQAFIEADHFRHQAIVYNDSTAILYVKLGANVSTDDWTVKLNPDDYYETPAGYTGPISGVWASAAGQARVTVLG